MKNSKDSENKVLWLPLGMSIGVSIGVAIGAALQNIPLWMCIGLSIGVGLGAVIDTANQRKAKEEADKEQNDEKKES